MNSDIPKQFMEIGKEPLLCHTIRRFYTAGDIDTILVTLPADYQDYWLECCSNYNFTIPHQIIPGGKERFDSIRAALEELRYEDGLVGIHDGVRPFASKSLIQKLFEEASPAIGAVPAIPVKDSVRRKNGDYWEVAKRSELRKIQTPQVFDLRELISAYETASQYQNETFSDDASVYEKSGKFIKLVDGEPKNFKVTDELDFKFAQFLAQNIVNE